MSATQRMLDNAATAAQSGELLEPATRGAVLRSLYQLLEHFKTVEDARAALARDPEFNE